MSVNSLIPAPTMIDLFSGCGGVTQGFKNKKFNVLAAVEIDPIAADTYSRNHPEVRLHMEDIRTVDPVQMMQDCGLAREELTVLSVCAPCQPFSRHSRRRDEVQARLVLEMVRFVDALQPQFAVMENVPELAKGQNKIILDELIQSLQDLGYNVPEPEVVDAVNYGVPQFRKRLILLCSREDIELAIPDITHISPEVAKASGKKRWLTVKEAFKGITRLASGQQSRTDPLHKARKHLPLTLERLKHIPKHGGSRKSLPEHLQLDCHRNGNGYNDVYGRMDPNKPSNTLTTGCTNLTKGRFTHPTANRAITPREATRLQTFPDFYLFSGGYDQISAQIGNAVPVLLVEAFADYFYELWQATVDTEGL